MLQLPVEDVHTVLQIVQEVCELWDDPVAWRTHLLNRAREILHASIGSMHGQTLSPTGEFHGPTISLGVSGMPVEIVKNVQDRATQHADGLTPEEVGTTLAPGLDQLFARFQHDGWATVSRSEITDDDTHYASAFHSYRSQAGCDDYLMSVRTVDQPGRIEVMTMDRPPGAPRFVPREVALLKVLHDEIAPLIGVRLATENHLCRDGLSRRLRQVLTALLDGSTEKAVAKELELSLPTVHEYVGMLYRHFHVRSRAELMAYFIRREPRLALRTDHQLLG